MSSGDYIKVNSLKPDFQNVNLKVKIVSIGSPRSIFSRKGRREHLFAEAFVGDETGSVLLTLWDDQIGKFKAGDVIEIRNGYTTLYKGSLRLNPGKNGVIRKIEDEAIEANIRNNLSERTHIHIPWKSREVMPFKRRKRR